MKILIINPNSDQEMTRAIGRSAENYAKGEFEVICQSTPKAPKFIETYEDESRAAPGMIELIRKNEDDCHAFVIACHCDPNLDLMKEIAKKPVVGIGEASMKMASMLGHRFSVISSSRHSAPNKEALVRKYHLQDVLASIRILEEEGACFKPDAEENYLKAGRSAVEEDGAEVVVLGCAGMTGMDKRLQEKLGVPVLDGIICGLIIAQGLARYGVSTSKARRYNPDL